MGCESIKVNCGNVIPGPPGKNGVGIAARTTVEPPGANLLYGGFKVEFGPDPDNDGIPNQILQTFYIPNGSPGTTYAIKATNIVGGSCGISGGIEFKIGIDSDNDGIPDTNITIFNVCNGINGISGITPIFVTGNTSTLSPGSQATSTVVPVPGQPNTYRIDIGVPTGAAGSTGNNTSNGITVGGVILPDCAAGFTGTTLTNYLQYLFDKQCAMEKLTSSDPLAFNAISDIDQLFNSNVSGGAKIPIYFNKDTIIPQYDNGNNFFGFYYRAPIAMTRSFVVQNIKLLNPTANYPSANTFPLTFDIMKTPAGSAIGGGSDSVLATKTYIYTDMDDYGIILQSIVNGTSIFSIAPLSSGLITLAIGDRIWVRYNTSLGAVYNIVAKTGSIFSNS